MLTIKKTSRFKREYRKAMKRGCDPALFEYVLIELVNGRQLAPKYRDHALTGDYEGFRECHIMPDWLFIYAIDGENLILVASRTGTHSDLFE
jgi:mRNA interferase YafQ